MIISYKNKNAKNPLSKYLTLERGFFAFKNIFDAIKEMLYYIYYGYIGGYTAYKIYEYWEVMRFAYTTYSYTYSAASTVYRWVKPQKRITEDLELSEWDMCDT